MHDLKHRRIIHKCNNKRLLKGTSKYYNLRNVGVYSNKKGKVEFLKKYYNYWGITNGVYN